MINEAYSKLLPKSGQTGPSQFLCQLTNISQCIEIDGQQRVKHKKQIKSSTLCSFD